MNCLGYLLFALLSVCSGRWAVTNRQRLLDLNSSLEFKLHRLYFISLLSGGIGNQMEALQYARHFQPFASQHQRGMTAFLAQTLLQIIKKEVFERFRFLVFFGFYSTIKAIVMII